MHKMQELGEHLQSVLLPPHCVSIPIAEDGFVSLRQQSGLSGEDETPTQTADNWRNKAIRRKLSKMKELVLFIGGLPTNFDKMDYINRISVYTSKREDASIGPVFPSQGCLFISFSSGMAAACTLKVLHERKIFGRSPILIFLPFINMPPSSANNVPLLVFINSKSGGGQGKQLLNMMKGILNKNQVFLLEQGGPIPGLYAFRKLQNFRILVCGGDGTAGWVLSALEQVHRHVACKNPPIAVLPLGTGNDLARVLGFGSGWSGEGIGTILAQVQEAQPVKMDRWTILFDSSPHVSPTQNQEQNQNEKSRKKNSPEEDAPSEKKIINGHKKLHRTCKSNPRRNRVNIVMGIGGNSEWKTADMFNSLEPDPDNVNTSNNLTNQPLVNGGDDSQITKTVSPPETDLSEKNGSPYTANEDAEVLSEDGRGEAFHSDTVPVNADEIENNVQNTVSVEQENSSETALEKKDYTVLRDDVNEETAHHRKTLHRKLQILSESDVLEEDPSPLSSLANLNRQISKCESISSEEDHERDPDSLENVEDCVLSQKGVEEILKSELPDIINDKYKLITLLASVNLESTKLDEIINAAEEEESAEASGLSDVQSKQVPNEFESGVNKEHSIEYPPIEEAGSRTGQHIKHRAMSDIGQITKGVAGFRKKMSLPLITEDRLYGLPSALEEIEEEDDLPPRRLSPGPKVVTMNNYFGLGIDAELSLAFHLAREENPEKFSSRLHNKAVYLKAGLKKMTTRSTQLNNIVDLEVNGAKVELPSIKGLIFLNISSWGGGSNAWGSGASRRFQAPSMGDGLLEVVGVGGVPHMSQMYSGIRNGFRIAQGEYVRMFLHAEVAVQVDGEPWMQPPGQIIITVSALQVMMLKRLKKKVK